MSRDEDEGYTSFKYGDPQLYAMLCAIKTITVEDYKTICREVALLRMFLGKDHGRAGAEQALARLQDKLQEIDQFVRGSLEGACKAEEEGRLALAGAVPTVKQEEKPPTMKFKLPPVDFDAWDGKQEKFFAWMSTVIKLIKLAAINDGQAQLMIMKKILENIRNQCKHLTSFTDVEQWLMGRYKHSQEGHEDRVHDSVLRRGSARDLENQRFCTQLFLVV